MTPTPAAQQAPPITEQELAELLEQNPEQAQEILEQLAQEHPEIAELLQKFAAESGGGAAPAGPAPPALPKPGEQNSLAGRVVRTTGRAAKEVAAAANPIYGGYRVGRRVAGYDGGQVPIIGYLGADGLIYAADEGDDEKPDSKPPAKPSGDAPDDDPAGAIGRNLEDEIAKLPPDGHDEWLANFYHAVQTHPDLHALVQRYCPEALEGVEPEAEGPEGETPVEPPLPKPGEQNALGVKTAIGTVAGGFIGGMAGHPLGGAAIGAGLGNAGAFDSGKDNLGVQAIGAARKGGPNTVINKEPVEDQNDEAPAAYADALWFQLDSASAPA